MEEIKVQINIVDYQPKDRYTTVSSTFESLKPGENGTGK